MKLLLIHIYNINFESISKLEKDIKRDWEKNSDFKFLMISIDNQLKQSINKSRSTIIWNSIENFLEKKKKKNSIKWL